MCCCPGTGRRFERAENPQPARDHVEVGRAVGARIKCDVLGMLDGDSVSVLQIENKGAERSLADETLNLGSNDGSLHRDDPSHVYFWASWQDQCLATRRIGPSESYQKRGAAFGVVAGRSGAPVDPPGLSNSCAVERDRNRRGRRRVRQVRADAPCTSAGWCACSTRE